MKKAINILALCAIFSMLVSFAHGQKRSNKGAVRKPNATAPRILCQGQQVPKGFVITGYKSSARCETSEVIMKKPSEIEIVCYESPIPDGYQVIGRQGSPTCNTSDSNPLTNALEIARDGSGASSQTTINQRNEVESIRQPRRVIQVEGGEDEIEDARKQLVVEQRAAEEQKKTATELAILHHEINVGMTMDQVLAAWGLPHDTDNRTQSGTGTRSVWYYFKNRSASNRYLKEHARLQFDNGVLTDYTWEH